MKVCIKLLAVMLALFLLSCGKNAKQPAQVSAPGVTPPDSRRTTQASHPMKPVSVPGAFPTSGGVPMYVHLFDDGSNDPDGGSIVKWEWNFGDQADGVGGWHDYTSTKGSAWHNYTHAGTIVAHLRVTDSDDGSTDVAFVKITMKEGLNANPVAVPHATPTSGNAPLPVAFSADGSYDPDGTIVKWEWDIGDGTFRDCTATNGEFAFTYPVGGDFTAVLRVTDNAGAMSSASVEIHVNATPPPAPSWCNASDGSFTDRVHVTWASCPGATSYKVYRDSQNSPIQSGITGTSYDDYVGDTDIHTYWVNATSASGDSGLSLCDTGYKSAGSGLANSAWPKSRGNARNTGLSPYVGAQTNAVKWMYRTGGWVASSPAIGADGTVYVGSGDYNMYALNPADGSVKWSYTTGNVVLSSAAIGADGTVYIGSDDYNVYALNPSDGTVKWTYRTGFCVVSSPAVGADGTVYIASGDGYVYALSPSDGGMKWKYYVGERGWSSPAIGADGTVYIGGGSNVYALNPLDGSVKWTSTAGGGGGSPAIGADGTVYTGSGRSVYALNPNGGVKWSYAADEEVVNSPAIGPDGTVYIYSGFASMGTCKMQALDPLGGRIKWSCACVWPVWSEGSIAIGADGTIYPGGFALSPADGSVKWSYPTGGGEWGQPAIGADGTVYVGNSDHNVYAFGPGGITHSVSGTVTLSGSGGFAGVTMTLTPGGLNATTQADGTYTIPGVVNGTYTLRPTESTHYFNPATRTVVVAGADVTGQDFTGFPGGLANSAWPKFHGNARNTGLSPYVGAQTNTVKWMYPIGPFWPSCVDRYYEYSPVIGADGTVYSVGSYPGTLYGFNPADGSVKWTYIFPRGGVDVSPAIAADGTIYVGGNFDVYALNPADGSEKWEHETTQAAQSGSAAVGADGTVYVGNDSLGFCALAPFDGSEKWEFSSWVFGCPAIGSDGTVYVGEVGLLSVFALNPTDGSVKWRQMTSDNVFSSPAIGGDGTVYFGSDDHNVYAVNPDGSAKWWYTTGDAARSSPAIGADGTVYIGSDDGNVYALNPADGTKKWQHTTGGAVESSPAIGADGTVYIGSYDGNVYALNPADGSIKWSYATGGAVIGSPAIGADGTVYIRSNDGNLYAFGP